MSERKMQIFNWIDLVIWLSGKLASEASLYLFTDYYNLYGLQDMLDPGDT